MGSQDHNGLRHVSLPLVTYPVSFTSGYLLWVIYSGSFALGIHIKDQSKMALNAESHHSRHEAQNKTRQKWRAYRVKSSRLAPLVPEGGSSIYQGGYRTYRGLNGLGLPLRDSAGLVAAQAVNVTRLPPLRALHPGNERTLVGTGYSVSRQYTRATYCCQRKWVIESIPGSRQVFATTRANSLSPRRGLSEIAPPGRPLRAPKRTYFLKFAMHPGSLGVSALRIILGATWR